MSEGNESLGEILGGSSAFHKPDAEPVKAEPKVEEPKVEPKTEAIPEPKAQVRDESGKFAKAEAPEEKPEEKPAKTPESALAEMSRRLRAAEARARELEQVSQKPLQPPPSIYEDEDGAINSRVDARTAHLRGALLNQSLRIAQMVHKDSWAEAEAGFLEAAEANPELQRQLREANDPGEFIYQTGIYHKEMAKYGGSVVAMRDAIRAEGAANLETANSRIKALEKELADMKAANEEAASLPKSLNKTASAQVTADTPTDPEDISQIVRFGKTG